MQNTPLLNLRYYSISLINLLDQIIYLGLVITLLHIFPFNHRSDEILL